MYRKVRGVLHTPPEFMSRVGFEPTFSLSQLYQAFKQNYQNYLNIYPKSLNEHFFQDMQDIKIWIIKDIKGRTYLSTLCAKFFARIPLRIYGGDPKQSLQFCCLGGGSLGGGGKG